MFVNAASRTSIGSSSLADRNIIAGNNLAGVMFTSNSPLGNTLMGNYIGIDKSGSALGNGIGVEIDGDSSGEASNIIVANNLISANMGAGVSLKNASFNTIRGNLIGVDPNGLAGPVDNDDNQIYGNGGIGVLLQTGTHGNLIGGPGAADGNIVAGNGGSMKVDSGSGNSNTIQGNQIGLDVSNTPDTNGIGIRVVSGNPLIEGNVIGGNSDGVSLEGNGEVVTGNWIGTDRTGTAHLGNNANGIVITGSHNVIGGTDPGMGNIIKFNDSAGVYLPSANAISNAIRGNSFYSNGNLGIALGDVLGEVVRKF